MTSTPAVDLRPGAVIQYATNGGVQVRTVAKVTDLPADRKVLRSTGAVRHQVAVEFSSGPAVLVLATYRFRVIR